MCKQGDIAWVLMPDPNRQNHKTRPFVIVSDAENVPDDEPLAGVAVSSQVPNPIPSNQVPLPWDNSRHRVTGLYKPSVAVCDWLATFSRAQIENIQGHVPGKQMVQIIRHISGYDSASP